MDFLFSLPYLFRIIVSLFAILVFQKLAKRLDVALLGGILLLAVWTGQSAGSIASVTAERVVSLDMLFLAFVIAGVIWLSSLMSQAGIMKDLVISLKSRLSKRAILAALPAVVGLLPMPAGALFSCPLVDDADSDNELTPKQKTEINYWFRHVWEFWWPLYPGMLLAVDMSGVPIWKFVLVMSPLFLAAITAGYVCLLRSTPRGRATARGPGDKSFLPLIAPTLTVIVVYAAILVLLPSVARFNRYLPMAIGVVFGLGMMQWQRPASLATWFETVFSMRSLSLVFIVVLARVYGAFIEARLPDGTSLMETVRMELNHYGIPALLLVVLIPFISGLTTGITIGYIGASFPVVLSLAGPGAGGLFSTIIIGYASGYVGMMLSPIHVCLIVTNEYFKTSLAGSLYGLVRPAAVLLALAFVYAGVWRVFG
ncbi:MAG: DUF401 family protein [Planctomycetaceae bacterium]|nr:DUF401 family protein [Planctomycetaceae bacterium]